MRAWTTRRTQPQALHDDTGGATMTRPLRSVESTARRAASAVCDRARWAAIVVALAVAATAALAQDVVDPRSGRLETTARDLVLNAGAIDVAIERRSIARVEQAGLLGTRWRLDLEARLVRADDIVAIESGAGAAVYTRAGDGDYRASNGDRVRVQPDGSAVRSRPDGTRETYDAQGRLSERDLRNGNVVRLRYGEQGRLARIEAPRGAAIELTTDGAGRVVTLRSSRGDRVEYRYDGGELVEVRRTDGVTRYAYAGGLLTRVERDGRATTIDYDATARVVARRFPDGSIERYERDDAARRVRIVDGGGGVTTLQWTADGRREELTDPAGGTSVVETDALGRLVGATGPGGRAQRRTYDAQHRLATLESQGKTTRFAYLRDTSLVTTMTTADGPAQRLEYDDRLNLTRVLVGSDVVLAMRYTADGLLASVSGRDVAEQHLGYDPAGRVASVRDATGGEVRFEYDERGRLVRSVNPLGGATTRTYDDAGRLLTTRSPSGGTTRNEYDAQGRLAAVIDPTGAATRFSYDDSGRLASVVDGTRRSTRFEYDRLGRLVAKSRNGAAAERFEYDAAHRLVAYTDRTGRTIRLAYDDTGRLAGERVADAALAVRYRYDDASRPAGWEDDLGGSASFQYDARGRLVAMGDARGATRYAYDERDRIVQIANPLQQTTRFEYDAAGRLVAVTGPEGSVARFAHDAGGRLTGVTFPSGARTRLELDAMGNTVRVIDAAGREMRYAYDDAGRIVSSTDAKGQTTTYEYDAADRVIARRYADGSQVRFEYDAAGRTRRVDDGKFAVEYGYDDRGRLARIAYPALKRFIAYEYLPTGERSRMIGADGRVTTYEYDAQRRLRAMRSGDAGAFTFEHDAKQRLASVRYPSGATMRWTYDGEDRATSVTHAAPDGRTIAGWRYEYDAAGNRVRTVDATGRTVEYRFDPAGQLVEERSADSTVRYEYLPGGNRGRRTGADDVRYRYDPTDRLVAAGDDSFVYDANGNLTQRRTPRGTIHYTYDAQNRLVKVLRADGSEISYGYAPTGDRVWRRDASGMRWYVHDGFNLVAELGENLAVVSSFVHAPGVDRPLEIMRGAQRRYYHADVLGSVAALTDERAQVVERYEYGAFGERSGPASASAASQPFGYTAREWDEASGLYYHRTRYYDPALGRFITADPVPGDRSDPLTLNAYAYALNNPLRYVDPLGTQSIGPIGDFPASGVGPMDALDPLRPRLPDHRFDPTSPGTQGSYTPSQGPVIYSKGPKMNDIDVVNGVREHELMHWKQWQLELQRRGIDEKIVRQTPQGRSFLTKLWNSMDMDRLERGAAWQQAHSLVRERGLSPSDPRVVDAINYYKKFGGDPTRLVDALERLSGKPPPSPLTPQEIMRALGPTIATAQLVSCIDLGKSWETCAVEAGVGWAVAQAFGRAAAAAGLTGPQAIAVGGALGWASVGYEGWQQLRDKKARDAQDAANKAQQDANRARIDDMRRSIDVDVANLLRVRNETIAQRTQVGTGAANAKRAADSARELLASLRDLKTKADPAAATCARAQQVREQMVALVASAVDDARAVVEKVNSADGLVASCATKDDVDQIGWLLQGARELGGRALANAARAEGLGNQIANLDLSRDLKGATQMAASLLSNISSAAADTDREQKSAAAAAQGAKVKFDQLAQMKATSLAKIAALRGAFPPDLQGTFEALAGQVAAAAAVPDADVDASAQSALADVARANGYANEARELAGTMQGYASCDVPGVSDLVEQARQARTDAMVYAGSDTPSKLQACIAKLAAAAPGAGGATTAGGPGSGTDSGSSASGGDPTAGDGKRPPGGRPPRTASGPSGAGATDGKYDPTKDPAFTGGGGTGRGGRGGPPAVAGAAPGFDGGVPSSPSGAGGPGQGRPPPVAQGGYQEPAGGSPGSPGPVAMPFNPLLPGGGYIGPYGAPVVPRRTPGSLVPQAIWCWSDRDQRWYSTMTPSCPPTTTRPRQPPPVAGGAGDPAGGSTPGVSSPTPPVTVAGTPTAPGGGVPGTPPGTTGTAGTPGTATPAAPGTGRPGTPTAPATPPATPPTAASGAACDAPLCREMQVINCRSLGTPIGNCEQAGAGSNDKSTPGVPSCGRSNFKLAEVKAACYANMLARCNQGMSGRTGNWCVQKGADPSCEARAMRVCGCDAATHPRCGGKWED